MPHLTNVSRPLIDLLSEVSEVFSLLSCSEEVNACLFIVNVSFQPCSSTGFLRKEAFAPSSVEATVPKTLKRKKLSLRDVGKLQ